MNRIKVPFPSLAFSAYVCPNQFLTHPPPTGYPRPLEFLRPMNICHVWWRGLFRSKPTCFGYKRRGRSATATDTGINSTHRCTEHPRLCDVNCEKNNPVPMFQPDVMKSYRSDWWNWRTQPAAEAGKVVVLIESAVELNTQAIMSFPFSSCAELHALFSYISIGSIFDGFLPAMCISIRMLYDHSCNSTEC